MARHADQEPASRLAGQSLLRAKEMSFIGDSDVGGGKTITTLKAAVSGATAHADQAPIKPRINQGLDIGNDAGEINTTNIAAASTVVGLAGNTAVDPKRTYGGPVVGG